MSATTLTTETAPMLVEPLTDQYDWDGSSDEEPSKSSPLSKDDVKSLWALAKKTEAKIPTRINKAEEIEKTEKQLVTNQETKKNAYKDAHTVMIAAIKKCELAFEEAAAAKGALKRKRELLRADEEKDDADDNTRREIQKKIKELKRQDKIIKARRRNKKVISRRKT